VRWLAAPKGAFARAPTCSGPPGASLAERQKPYLPISFLAYRWEYVERTEDRIR